MDPIDALLLDLGNALVELFRINRGAIHGIYQGSHEAALFEAQGGMIGPGGFNHLQSVIDSAAAIQTRQDAANLALNRINGVDPVLGPRVRALCQPVLDLGQRYLDAAAQTRNAAAVLQQTNATRLQGVVVGQGGLGPEIVRSEQALVSNQLTAMAQQLEARGIEPRLIPQAQSALQSTLNAIKQLPIDGREAAHKLGVVLASIRLLVRQTAVRAAIIGRARLLAVLLGIEQALVAFGSRLTTPILIDMRVIHQTLGISGPEA
ncbi:hypothetical protein [Knoellia aerolata]|uniref:Uncharacterized protein n=1 Tax=Knoellia aerolata DSM 18566 TaxID=1385519 RepID=A0A0A0JR71_9MICO|nr:hypothetical protein [Knoellia aerolata]KGN39708.1 hypothetical protein N801_19535 [Knoellia aerolata DSM 18566]